MLFILKIAFLLQKIHSTTITPDVNNESCKFDGIDRKDGEFWLHQNFFNVTCMNGKIQVVNCVTEKGTQIPLGTTDFHENGFSYACKLHLGENSQQNMDDNHQNYTEEVTECDFLPANGRAEYVRSNYAISCLDNKIIGCVDAHGDLARSGQFLVLPKGQLRRCVVYGNGRWAKMEGKGCFNGTQEDDPSNQEFHVAKGRIWRRGNFEFRCGEEGIHVYKCLFEGRRIHVGTAWVDNDNVLNVCQ